MPGPGFGQRSLAEFVDVLASGTPVPGGGSASAVAASLAAALVAMVATLSDRPRYADHATLHAQAGETGRRLAAHSLRLADEDAGAYAALAAALKLPRQTDAEIGERERAIAAAARGAAEVPLRSVEVCREIVAAAESLAGRSNVNAASDLVVSALLADAAARGAALNVRVNLPSVADGEWAADAERRLVGLLEEVARLASATQQIVASGEARAAIAAAPTPAPA